MAIHFSTSTPPTALVPPETEETLFKEKLDAALNTSDPKQYSAAFRALLRDLPNDPSSLPKLQLLRQKAETFHFPEKDDKNQILLSLAMKVVDCGDLSTAIAIAEEIDYKGFLLLHAVSRQKDLEQGFHIASTIPNTSKYCNYRDNAFSSLVREALCQNNPERANQFAKHVHFNFIKLKCIQEILVWHADHERADAVFSIALRIKDLSFKFPTNLSNASLPSMQHLVTVFCRQGQMEKAIAAANQITGCAPSNGLYFNLKQCLRNIRLAKVLKKKTSPKNAAAFALLPEKEQETIKKAAEELIPIAKKAEEALLKARTISNSIWLRDPLSLIHDETRIPQAHAFRQIAKAFQEMGNESRAREFFDIAEENEKLERHIEALNEPMFALGDVSMRNGPYKLNAEDQAIVFQEDYDGAFRRNS